MQKGAKIAIGIIAGLGLVYAGIRAYSKVPDVTVDYNKKTGAGTIQFAGQVISFDKSQAGSGKKTWNGVDVGVSGSPMKVLVRKNGKVLMETGLDGYGSSGSSEGRFKFTINRTEA